MKRLLLALTISVALLPLRAAEPTPAAAPSSAADSSTPAADLQFLVARIQAKLKKGATTAAELAEELPLFDLLLTKYSAQKTDDVAQILLMQATLHAQVLGDTAKARELFLRLKTEFPATQQGANADRFIADLDRAAKAELAKTKLVGQPAPELHFKWSSLPSLKTLSDLRGKVVVLDFWATWCGPCVASFPHVRELTTHYQDSDVVVLGVTSLQGRVHGLETNPIDTRGKPERELALMTDYIKAKNITWLVAFSDEEVFNPDYGISGIPHMAIIAPDGTVRHTGLHPAMPQEDKVAKIDALLTEFGKKLPAPTKS